MDRVSLRVFKVMAALLAAYAVALSLSATFWFEPHKLYVNGATLEVTLDRDIHRPFQGTYAVIIREAETLEPVCDARGGPFGYKPRSQFTAKPIPMADWAPSDPRCQNIPPHKDLYMETCWNVLLPLLPPKTVCVESNVFRVNPGELK